MRDPHVILTNVLKKFTIDGNEIFVLKYRIFLTNIKFRFLNFVVVFLNNLIIAFAIWLVRGKKIVVREFSNWAIVILVWVFFLKRKKLYFVINHNIPKSSKPPLPLLILLKLGFQFIFFDGAKVKNMIGLNSANNIFTPLFPIDSSRFKKKYVTNEFQDFLKIGIVGDFREEKIGQVNLKYVLSEILNIRHVKLLIGLRDESVNLDFFGQDLDGVEFFKTGKSSDYVEFLSKIDIGIILASDSAYYFRNSGTIMDFAASGVIIVAPRFPVFESQLSYPYRIGETYADIMGLISALNLIIERRNFYHANLIEYISKRSVNGELITR